MARQKLTQERIRKCECPSGEKQCFIWDTNVKGLGVRVTPSSKSFIFQDKLDGKSIRVKIGDTATWPVDSSDPSRPGARQEASRLKGLIDKGVDPREEKRERNALQAQKLAQQAREKVTVEEAWNAYLAERRSFWGARHYEEHLRLAQSGGRKKKRGKGKTTPGVLSALMALKLSDLDTKRVIEWVTREAKNRPGQARLAFSLLRAFVKWCERKDTYQGLADPYAFDGMIKKDVLSKQQAKSDSLQREQLPGWFASVRKIPNKVISTYLQILLLTGARRGELLSLQWGEVEFTWRSLIIADKMEGRRTIPMTPYVAYLLRNLPRKNSWVFPSMRAASGHLEVPRKAHVNAIADAGINNLTIHGLRRSFSNLSEWVEVPVGIVYQIQGHKPSATAEKHYKQRPLDLLRKWHEKIEEWILSEAGIDTSHLEEECNLRLVQKG